MSSDNSYDPAPFYVLNLKYVFEGILTPTIGSIGIIGIQTAMIYCQAQVQVQVPGPVQVRSRRSKD